MQPLEPRTIVEAVLGVVQWLVLAPLGISAALAVWRAVADYVRGDEGAVAGIGQ